MEILVGVLLFFVHVPCYMLRGSEAFPIGTPLNSQTSHDFYKGETCPGPFVVSVSDIPLFCFFHLFNHRLPRV